MIQWCRGEWLERWLQARIPALAAGGIGAAQYAVAWHGNSVVAVWAFHQYDQIASTLQLTGAADSPRWATRGNIATLMAYPFERAGVNKLWTWTAATNQRALRINTGLGLHEQARIPDQCGPGIAAVICGMTRAEWQRSKWRDVWANL